MKKAYNDEQYLSIVNNILTNDSYKQIDKYKHHGQSRLDHCMRVSYYSYRVSKLLHLDIDKTARAGLLHDFFMVENENGKDKFKSVFTHSKLAAMNADNNFNISEMEYDIIRSHMFPLASVTPPKYLEGWVVSLVDKAVAIGEFTHSYSNNFSLKFRNASVILALFLGQVMK